MPAQKLTCPECSTVLRPARPVAAGKKVKCPRCETVFTAGDDEDDAHEAPTIKPSKARAGSSSSREGKASKASSSKGRGPSKPGKPAKAAAKADEKPKEETYGVVKDPEEEENTAKKLKIDYAPDDTIKDLRGPAVALLVKPTNWMAILGFAGFFGWLTLIVFIVIPAAFPLRPEKSEVMRVGEGLGAVNPGGFGGMMFIGSGPAGQGDSKKFEEETASFFEVFGIDLWVVGQQPWYYFWPGLIPFVIVMFVSGLVGYGAVQAQNLESRRWGIAGSILAMIPLTTGGIQLVSIMCAQFFLGMVSDDHDFIQIVGIIIAVVEWLASLGVGIWVLVTLLNEDVIAGFEYVAE